MFPVYSVTHVPGLYPVLHSVGLLNVLQRVRLRGPSVARLDRSALSSLRDENLWIFRARWEGVSHFGVCPFWDFQEERRTAPFP